MPAIALSGRAVVQLMTVVVIAAVAYWLAAQAGRLFMLERVNLSMLWPAAGVALALVCRLGPAAAVGAGLGAFVAQYGLGHSMIASLSVAAGVMVAPALAARLLAASGARFALDRSVDVFRFLLAGVLPASVISSLAGATVMWLAGSVRWEGFGSLWWVCWVADLMGILLLTPALLVPRPRLRSRAVRVEAVVMAVLTVLAAGVVYGDILPPGAMLGRPLAYAIFPLVIWSAMRAGPALTVWLLLVHAGIAVALTAGGHGPFADHSLRYGMLSLHAHLAMVSLTGLLLAAAVAGRRQIEEEARDYLHELSHASRVSAMGEMAAGLAHELNQPLCAIATYSQAARRMLSEDADPALARALERLDSNAQRAGGIIRQMRSFIQRGSPEAGRVDVNALVRDGLELTAPALRQGEVSVQTRLDPELPVVEAAPVQIHQVLVNLVRNAVEALAAVPAAGRRLEITTARGGNGGVMVTVADSGPGIPETLGDGLFEPFVSGRGDGMGLGLSISRSIIEYHGGTLSAAPRSGGGTVFRFELPARAARRGHES